MADEHTTAEVPLNKAEQQGKNYWKQKPQDFLFLMWF